MIDQLIKCPMEAYKMCSPQYNRRVTNRNNMFDKQLKPIYEGRVLVNQSAMDNPVVQSALFAMSKRNFEPQRINNYGVWYISDRH